MSEKLSRNLGVKPLRDFEQGDLQHQVASQAAKVCRAKSAAIRFSFIARTDASAPVPPMTRLLRGGGGRGGAARLKLFLTFLWLARGRSKPVFSYRSVELAALLGLPSPEAAGARRVQEALRWLETEGFVLLDRRPGDATRVHLLDDAGSGERYEPPGPLVKKAYKRSQEERARHFYVQLPSEFWTEGWVTELSGAAVTMYLSLLHEAHGRLEKIWISPRIGRERYALSDDTRSRGLKELTDYGLVEVTRRQVPQISFDEDYRTRNVYRLVPNGFQRLTSSLNLQNINPWE